MPSGDKRSTPRVPLQLCLTEHVHDHTQQSLILNLCARGVYVSRLDAPSVLSADDPRSKVLGLEFRLPELDETIWAAGEVCHRQRDAFFQNTGVRFIGIAGVHRRLIDEYVADYQIRLLRQLLARVRRNRSNVGRPVARVHDSAVPWARHAAAASS